MVSGAAYGEIVGSNDIFSNNTKGAWRAMPLRLF